MATITTIASGDAISASRSVINTNFTNLNTDKAELSGATFTGDIIVPAEVYGAGWNGSNEAPTKNDLYDKIETLGGTGDVVGPASATDNAIARYDTTTGKLIQNSGVTIGDTNIISGVATLNVAQINSTAQNDFSYNFSDTILSGGGFTFYGATHRRINDGGSNEYIKFPTSDVGGAINEFTISNAATGNGPTISSTGGDTNIDFNIVTKGTGILKVNGSAVATGNVTKVGTPVNNQVGVWTGDGTIEGDTALTFDTATDTLTAGIFNGTALTASQLTATDASKNIVSLAVATYPSLTELTYVKGVTSAIQTQIGTKAPSASPTFTGTVTLPSVQLGEESIKLDSALSADGKWSGITETGTAGATLAFGDLCYFQASDSRWELADANLSAGYDKKLGMCVLAAASDGSATEILLIGKIRADANFPTLTIGSPVYMAETAGDIVVAQPVTADACIRVVGYANTADELYFNPSSDYIIHV